MKYSNACSRYGASMGRPSTSDRELSHIDGIDVKLKLQRVPLDSGGYDPGGAYWGHGSPLWRSEGSVELATGSHDITLYLRVSDRDHAKSMIRAKLRAARFYR
jgi:hypothetical protein